MKTKEHDNTNTIPRNVNVGRGAECLEMNFVGKKYDTQFTSTGRTNINLCMTCTN